MFYPRKRIQQHKRLANHTKTVYNCPMSMDISVYTGGPCMCNGYLVRGEDGYIAIDAPLGFTAWVRRQLQEGERVSDLLITHQHFDHVQDAAELARTYGCCIHACKAYSRELTLETLARSSGWGIEVEPFTVDDAFGPAATEREWGGLRWHLHHIPGHSPDGMAYGLPEHEQVFCGDILFAGSVGRTDFPGGSMSQLVRGIREQLLCLPHTTTVHSGHGPATTLAEEQLNNPYL